MIVIYELELPSFRSSVLGWKPREPRLSPASRLPPPAQAGVPSLTCVLSAPESSFSPPTHVPACLFFILQPKLLLQCAVKLL